MNEKIRFLKTKIVLPFFAAIVLILASVAWNFYTHLSDSFHLKVTHSNEQLSNILADKLYQETERLRGFAHFVLHDDAITQAWSDLDRDQLYSTSVEDFQFLLNQYKVTHFYFHKPDGSVFLRVHAKEKHGDLVNRHTMKAAITTGETSSGIEFGTFGQFVLRVVVPWKVNGEIVGYLELGEEIVHILERIAKNSNYDLVLSVSKDYLSSKDLLSTAYFQTRNIEISQYKNQVIVGKTLEHLSPDITRLVDTSLTASPEDLKITNELALMSQIDFPDVTGENVGRLTYITDESSEVALISRFIKHSLFSVLTITVFIAIFFYLYSDYLDRYLRRIYSSLDKEIDSRKSVEDLLRQKSNALEKSLLESDENLMESRRRYETLFEKSADALLLIQDHDFIDCNQATLEMLGYDNKEELYQTHPSVLSPEFQPDGQTSQEKADLMIETAMRNGSHRFEWDHKRKNGEVFPVEVLLTAIPYRDSQLLHVVWRDITERKKAAEEIEFQALYDSLTNLPNRRLLFDRISQSLVTARRHDYYNALLFVDLDRFKNINDSLGHSVGDELLKETANRIKSCLSREDTASRFGGDEFVILIRHAGDTKESAGLTTEKIALRLKEKMSQPIFIEDKEFHVTVSIGIALFPIHDETVDDIIKHADTAMYSAKESGRDSIAFYLSDMHEKVMQRLHLEQDLRKAVKEEELQIYYQPQYDSNGKIIAVEALARWIHEEHGFISPEEFINIAEETGIIFELGTFVLRKSALDIKYLNSLIPDDENIGLAVNISQKQFDKDNFIGTIRDVIENFGFQRNQLTLEVTEGLAINNLNRTVERLEQLRHLGVRVSLDDFGTGYSSLSYLKRLPLDELKIDKSFVFDVLDDPQDAQLIRTIISISHQFGLVTVAEGVETKEQEGFLQQLHCDIFQGYYFSKPVPIDELTKLIAPNHLKQVL